MAETMVERAAKAHYERLHYTPWEKLTPSTRAGFIGAMRAAIEAMREPTDAMRRAGREQILSRRASELSVVHIFTAMIDAILKED